MWDKPQLLMWMANLLTGLAALLFLYAAIVLLIHSPLFPVRQIKVEGQLSHVTREQLQYIVKHEMRGTFFTLDLNRTRQAFEKLPWVRQVNLRRRWPDRLDVNIEEHVALARWGTLGLINTLGERFDAASNDNLPVLEGPDGTETELAQGFQNFQTLLRPLKKQPTHVWMSARRAWRMQLDSDVIVEVGRDGPEGNVIDGRMKRFVATYQQTLALVNRPVDYVDLRYPNGFAVRIPGFSPQKAAKVQVK